MGTPDEVIPTTVDSMKDLDNQTAVTSTDKENVPKKSNIMFVRGETQSKSVLEAEKETTVNPDAIDLDDDHPDEEGPDLHDLRGQPAGGPHSGLRGRACYDQGQQPLGQVPPRRHHPRLLWRPPDRGHLRHRSP